MKKKNWRDKRTTKDVDGIVRLLGLSGREKILDIPCGYGGRIIDFARKGFSVKGVDDAIHLEEARRRATEAGVNIDLQIGSLLSISYFRDFDCLINMNMLSFGFFETDRDNKKALKKIFRALKPDGKFLGINLGRLRLTGNRFHNLKKKRHSLLERDKFFNLCFDVGFLACEAYGNWQRELYNEKSEQIILIARKKEIAFYNSSDFF